MIFKGLLLASATLVCTVVMAQETGRQTSSMYLPAYSQADVSLSFDIKGEGKRFQPTWGLDQAWINEQCIKKGINHMGKDNIGIGRIAFRFTDALVNDTELTSNLIQVLRQRANLFNQVSTTLPLTFTADQEAGTNEYYVKNKVANNDHWAAMINAHVQWIQKNTLHPVAGISPFNEGDYWTTEEGASATKQWQVAKLLKESYPSCSAIPMVGGNTLNNDKALSWYTGGKQYYDWGNTHQLAGSFNTFAGFFQQLQNDGKVGYADEMHNVGEAMIGLEYGMTVGIWWGFDSRARGEFCQISRHGVRLAYGEHRNNWTAASVYRHDDGRVKAFIGSSERQAATTKYQFVSTDREVYYDGYGPVREFCMEIPGGTGYQTGQTNAERVIDVTWGEDVPAVPVTAGAYRLLNKGNGKAMALSAGNIILATYSSSNKLQQWNLSPAVSATCRWGGDFSFYDITSVSNSAIRMNVVDFSTSTNGKVIAYDQNPKADSNEQWYLEYAGDNFYYIRNRESALYLSYNGDDVVQKTLSSTASASVKNNFMWRIIPTDVKYERMRPAQPTGLAAEARAASVTLSWTANQENDLAGYIVMRAEKGTDDWNTIARMISANTFTDNTCRQGVTYCYKIRAIDHALNRSLNASETVEATPSGERSLVAHWPFEENLDDASLNMMDAKSSGTLEYVDRTDGDKVVGKGVNLNSSSNQYIQLPYEVAGSDELSVAMWVYIKSYSNWQRIFDFGYDTDHYMFLTPRNGSNSKMRFAIKNGGDEQTVDCSTSLSTFKWKHVAVTIGKDKTTVYVDGQEVGSSTGITIRPTDIHPVLNYLGRSQFTSDPYLNAYLSDVRIYNYAVSADDVQTIMNGGILTGVKAPESETAPMKVYGLDGVERNSLQKGLNIIDGKKVLR